MYTGKTVRLKGDPGKRGVCTGQVRQTAGRDILQVIFPERMQYVPLDQLDFLGEQNETPFDLLKKGRLGNHGDLRRILTHIRLSGRLVDLIYSMEITNTDFYAYQFKPVLKLLNSMTSGILIADEVGLGKTIEAGLIWTELKSRFDLRRLMILCPAMLREKWQYELRYRFGIKAEIVNSNQTLKTLEQIAKEGAFSDYTIICSMQGLRSRKASGFYRDSDSNQLSEFLKANEEENPLIDCLIIDEAHYLRNWESKTAKLGKQLRQVTEYMILLSATPVHLRSTDLYSLLNLLDADTFNHPAAFDSILLANAPLIAIRDALIARNISQREFIASINQALSHPLLKDSRQLAEMRNNPPTDQELSDYSTRSYLANRFDSINSLGHVVTRSRKREVTEWRVTREPVAETIPLNEPERKFYDLVTEKVREACAKANYYEGFMLVSPQRQMSSSMAAALREWKRRKDKFKHLELYEDSDSEDDTQPLKIGPVILELLRNVEAFGSYESLYQNDSKFARLAEILKKLFEPGSDEKVILFSYFRSTIDYLSERLKELGMRSYTLKGGDEFDKNQLIEEFRASRDIKILLSTEVGSEGIDLQFCRILINYDLPWNPMRVEQRIGRIDRLGQKAEKVIIWNLFYQDTIDDRIYDRLYKRLDLFRTSLGGLEPILGDEIRQLTFSLLSKKLTPDQEQARIDQTALACETRRNNEENLEQEASHLMAYGDYVLNKVKAARELNRWINSQDIKNYVIDYLRTNYPGCEIKLLDEAENIYEIVLTDKAKHDLESFIKEKRINIPTNLIRTSHALLRYRFANKLFDESSKRIELINQIHPLVRFVTYRQENEEQLPYPAVAISLIGPTFRKGLYVFSVQRWSFRALQDIEKLYYAAVRLGPEEELLSDQDAESLIVHAATKGDHWFEVVNQVDLNKIVEAINQYCLSKSDIQYQRELNDLQNMNYDRAAIQINTLKNHLENQKQIKLAVKRKHEELGRDSLAKATQGLIDALESRVNRRILSISERTEIQSNQEEVAVGIIRVRNGGNDESCTETC